MHSLRTVLARRCDAIDGIATILWRRYISNTAHSDTLSKLNKSLEVGKTFEIKDLNVYTTSAASDPDRNKDVEKFFTRHTPALLFSKPHFRELPPSDHPEVTVLGRSNVGKSSLLNALFNESAVALTSSKPGKTKLLNGFGVSPHAMSAAPRTGTKGEIMAESWRRMQQGLILVDMPGYGKGSRTEWGQEIMKYLQHRRQLRRAFVLVDSEHGLKTADLSVLEQLYRYGIPHTIVLSKIDKILYPGPRPLSTSELRKATLGVQQRISDIREQLKTKVWQGRDAATDILCVSSRKSMDEGLHRRKIGIDELRWVMLCACGYEGSSKASPTSLGDINIID